MNELDTNEYILIRRKDYQDLIDGAKQDEVDTELLEAIYKWLNSHNIVETYNFVKNK
jgi:hypothetical protein